MTIMERPDALSCATRCVHCGEQTRFVDEKDPWDLSMFCSECGEEQPALHRHNGVFADDEGTEIVCTFCGCILEDAPSENTWVPEGFTA